jgi:glycosyl transferase family 25
MNEQAIPVYVINLDRRPDRLERIGTHLAARGVRFIRQPACDAQSVPEAEIAKVVHARGPLGVLGLGDRACTISHTWAWQAFLDSDASHALFLEDDIYLAEDLAEVLESPDWIPAGTEAVKLEKFNDGASTLLLGPAVGATPSGRALHPMCSRHVGGGAYILSRKGAETALAHRGRFRVPIDHFLFNDTVSPIRRALAPAMVVPAMATQRAYDYNSDIKPFGKAVQPTGFAKRLRTLRRGLTEVNQAPRQILQWTTRRATLMQVSFAETPPGRGR